MLFDNLIVTSLYYALFLIFIVIIIFLVTREINLWYWRINERIELLEKMTKSLEFLENENSEWKKYENEKENEKANKIKELEKNILKISNQIIDKSPKNSVSIAESEKDKFNKVFLHFDILKPKSPYFLIGFKALKFEM